jgi:hypothetical protein
MKARIIVESHTPSVGVHTDTEVDFVDVWHYAREYAEVAAAVSPPGTKIVVRVEYVS